MTRYRLDPQFHCSYLDSRGVPEKPREKTREIISLSFPVHDFRWRHFRWCNFRWRHFRWCNFRSRMRSLPVTSRSTTQSTTNTRWMVHLYYYLTLWKWCYTPLQHDFALDPMIPPFVFHFSRDYEKTTITAMYHGGWFAYKQTNKYLYCQSYMPVKAEQLT